MDMLRHVAKLVNTDQRCVVAFMQIPNREDHALIIPIDNLPPRMEQAVMDVLNSPDGQNEETFALALSRNLMPDTGEDILKTLHATNRLTAVPVSQVVMMPRPNQPVKLSTVLEQLGRLPNQQTQGLMEEYALNKYNPHVANQNAETAENNRTIARNLLVEAEMLESDAQRKRERAYGFDPMLRPKVVGNGHDRASPVAVQPVVAELVAEPVVEPSAAQSEPQPDANSELTALVGRLMERVEEQDKLLTALRERPTEGKHGSRRSRSAHS